MKPPYLRRCRGRWGGVNLGGQGANSGFTDLERAEGRIGEEGMMSSYLWYRADSPAHEQVGKHHEISAGLLIGGKDVKEEQSSVSSMNILVATPGRLLQVSGGEGGNMQEACPKRRMSFSTEPPFLPLGLLMLRPAALIIEGTTLASSMHLAPAHLPTCSACRSTWTRRPASTPQGCRSWWGEKGRSRGKEAQGLGKEERESAESSKCRQSETLAQVAEAALGQAVSGHHPNALV